MSTYIMKLTYLWDGCNDICEIKITVPSNITPLMISEKLQQAHDFLDQEDEEDIYGTQGRCPETLLDYICERNEGWNWSHLQYDGDLIFD